MIDLPFDLSSMLILQIHDELLFEVPEEKAQDYAAQITQIMENAIELTVPLKVDIKIGNHW
jgi:DNA polymerase-1